MTYQEALAALLEGKRVRRATGRYLDANYNWRETGWYYNEGHLYLVPKLYREHEGRTGIAYCPGTTGDIKQPPWVDPALVMDCPMLPYPLNQTDMDAEDWIVVDTCDKCKMHPLKGWE
jgi:hypothetical protein